MSQIRSSTDRQIICRCLKSFKAAGFKCRACRRVVTSAGRGQHTTDTGHDDFGHVVEDGGQQTERRETADCRGDVVKGRPHILWIGIAEPGCNVDTNSFTSIPISLGDERVFETPSVFPGRVGETITTLQETLGPAFITKKNKTDGSDDSDIIIHQAVLTMLLTAREAAVSVEFANWETIQGTLATQLARHAPPPSSSFNAHPELVVYVDCNHFTPKSLAQLRRLYSELYHVQAAWPRPPRIVPSRQEMEWEQYKIGDISALDDIAGLATDPRFKFRPVTCPGRGPCKLAATHADPGATVVVKRTHSSGSADVHLRSGGDRRNLLCTTSPADDDGCVFVGTAPGGQEVDRDNGSAAVFFHQEYMPALQSVGEFRVFLIDGRIVATVHTKIDWPTQMLAARLVESDADLRGHLEATPPPRGARGGRERRPGPLGELDELHELVQYVHGKMRGRGGGGDDDCFATLSWLGARYDCGMGPDGRWFVNEVTRLPGAVVFSADAFNKPYTKVVAAMAQALAKELRRRGCCAGASSPGPEAAPASGQEAAVVRYFFTDAEVDAAPTGVGMERTGRQGQRHVDVDVDEAAGMAVPKRRRGRSKK